MELSTRIISAFDQVKARSRKDIHISTMGITINDSVFGAVKGYYGFYTSGAVRFDVNADGDVVQVAIWNSPGDLNKPDVKIDTSNDEIENQIQTIVSALEGSMIEDSFLASESHLREGAIDDVAEFLQKVPAAAQMKGSEAYASYMKWANQTGHKEMSGVYFGNNLRKLKANGMVAGATPKAKSSAPAPEETAEEPSEEDLFVNDIMDNEIYYKASMYESLLTRMAKGEPRPVSLFIYGSPGLGKTYTCKKIFREMKVWDKMVTYKSGSIAGFTGLLQLLWDNRKGKIIVLDDNDSLLVGNIAAANILKAVLNSDPEDRVVSYTKLRR